MREAWTTYFAGINNKYHNLVSRAPDGAAEGVPWPVACGAGEDFVLRLPAVLAYDHNNLVHRMLAPLEAFLDLNAAELKKTALRLAPNVLSCNHDSLVAEKLDPLQARLELTDAELKKKEIGLRLPAVLRLQPRQPGGGESEGHVAVCMPAASTAGT
jgi:hypothetical protein